VKRGRTALALSVVVTTYEWPEALDAVLQGLADQSDPAFDIVVADDGSGPATGRVVDRWRERFSARLTYAWQPDEGFRLARARNLGAAKAGGSYLVFVDGDCIPRRSFVSAIRRAALPGWFLAGKRVQMSSELSRAILENRPVIGRWSVPTLWLRARREITPWTNLTPRDRRRPWRPKLPDFAPYGNEYGFLTAVARSDFERVNGFDARFVGWGDQDVDLAVRLRRLGLRCSYAGPHATMLHLWHTSSMTPDRPTWWLLQETVQSERIEAVEGLRELPSELRIVERVAAGRVTESASHSGG
jgi:GT2 family glycosyltransferase